MTGLELKIFRKNLKLNQREFADQINMSRQTIMRFEKGLKISEESLKLIEYYYKKNNPTVEVLELAKSLDKKNFTIVDFAKILLEFNKTLKSVELNQLEILKRKSLDS